LEPAGSGGSGDKEPAVGDQLNLWRFVPRLPLQLGFFAEPGAGHRFIWVSTEEETML